MARSKKPLNERIAEADTRSSQWLADGNEAAERGDHERAEFCYAKSQFWIDRLNSLLGYN